MKLSTAILKGCELRPIQCRGTYLRGVDKACAIGAAAVAEGALTNGHAYSYADSTTVFTADLAFKDEYGDFIANANDSGMLREEIAAMLQLIGH